MSPDRDPAWFEDLGLSVRTQNCLDTMDVPDRDALLALTDRELLRTKNFGRRCLDEVRAAGLRADTCPLTVGCYLPAGHDPFCRTYQSAYSQVPQRLAEPETGATARRDGSLVVLRVRGHHAATLTDQQARELRDDLDRALNHQEMP